MSSMIKWSAVAIGPTHNGLNRLNWNVNKSRRTRALALPFPSIYNPGSVFQSDFTRFNEILSLQLFDMLWSECCSSFWHPLNPLNIAHIFALYFTKWVILTSFFGRISVKKSLNLETIASHRREMVIHVERCRSRRDWKRIEP